MSGSSLRRSTALVAGVTACLLAAPLAPAWAASDDRLLLVEQTTWGAEVREADGQPAFELYAGAPDSQQLARGGSWLPDASGVVVLDQPQTAPGRPGFAEVVLVSRDGSSRRTLARDGITGIPVASPDGRTVAFPSDDEVQLVGTDGSGRRTLATVSESSGFGAVHWSPDGRWLALLVVADSTGDTSLWRVDAAGGGLTQVSAAGERVAGYGVGWSPDSATLAYGVQADDGPHVVLADDSGSQRLTSGREPVWSPDGRFLAVTEGRLLRVVDATDGEEVTRWETGETCLVTSPTWSPDSASVAFSRAYTGAGCSSGEAMVLDVASGTAAPLPEVSGAKYGYALAFAPLPTSLPPARTSEQSCPEGEVPEDGFADTAGSFFESDIDCVTWWGLARGNGSGFAPEAPVSRTQTALLLARLLREAGVPLDGRNPGFTDTAGLSPEAREAINNVANAQVARGTSATTFTPAAPVTRGQLASFLVRLQAKLGVELPLPIHCFADTSSSVHRQAAERLCAAGVARGDGAGGFAPGTPVTRGQVAGLLARVLDLDVEAGRLSPPSS